MTHYIKPSELEAVALASSNDGIRYYLNGVCFELYKGNSLAGMIATDGHRLHAMDADKGARPKTSFILPIAEAKKALSIAKAHIKMLSKASKELVRIGIEQSGAGVDISILDICEGEEPVCSVKYPATLIDGTFPDWRRRVLPAGGEACATGFNQAYLSDFARAAKLMVGKNAVVVIESTGATNPARVLIPAREGFLGVLMPMRF